MAEKAGSAKTEGERKEAVENMERFFGTVTALAGTAKKPSAAEQSSSPDQTAESKKETSPTNPEKASPSLTPAAPVSTASASAPSAPAVNPGITKEQANKEAFKALSSKKYAQAARAFTQVLSFDPQDAVTWGNLGAAYYLFVQANLVPYVGQNWLINLYVFDETNRISARLRTAALSAMDPNHLAGLRQCLAQAENCFNESLRLRDRPSTARYWHALVYRNTGRFEQALKELEIMTGPGASQQDSANAEKDLADLRGTTWESVNAGALPPQVAATKIELLFGDELRSLLANPLPLPEGEGTKQTSQKIDTATSKFQGPPRENKPEGTASEELTPPYPASMVSLPGGPAGQTEAGSPTPSQKPKKRRNPALWIIAAASTIVLVALGLAGFFFFGTFFEIRQPPKPKEETDVRKALVPFLDAQYELSLIINQKGNKAKESIQGETDPKKIEALVMEIQLIADARSFLRSLQFILAAKAVAASDLGSLTPAEVEAVHKALVWAENSLAERVASFNEKQAANLREHALSSDKELSYVQKDLNTLRGALKDATDAKIAFLSIHLSPDTRQRLLEEIDRFKVMEFFRADKNSGSKTLVKSSTDRVPTTIREGPTSKKTERPSETISEINQNALKARTEVAVLKDQVNELESSIRGSFRKVLARAETEQVAGNILLTKEKYSEAVAAFGRAAALYRQALEGKKILERLAEAQRQAARGRILAEALAPPDKILEAARLETNAEGFMEAGEFDGAIAELVKARLAYEKPVNLPQAATLEQVVAARTAMQAVRKLVKDQSPKVQGPSRPVRKGSLTALTERARKAEKAASEALEVREYPPALVLYQAADKLFREAGALQVKRDAVLALHAAARQSLTLADGAFKTEARPVSFERGKQLLADADKALADEDLDTAKKLSGEAGEFFAKAKGEAELANELAKAQESWAAALAGIEEDVVAKYAAGLLKEAKTKKDQAEARAAAGQMEDARKLFGQASLALKTAALEALTQKNLPKAPPLIAKLETAISSKEKFKAEDMLADLEKLIPSDKRLESLRKSVEALPGPKKQITVKLSDKVDLELVLIRPGSFIMGNNSGDSKEKPEHKVTITRPFYLGKYEVTHAQWAAVLEPNVKLKPWQLPTGAVTGKSWERCQSFADKLNHTVGTEKGTFRLPTEAEWEYACRAGTTTKYYFGDEDSLLENYEWFSGNYQGGLGHVGQKRPNGWGLYDMLGNVSEWCRDYYGQYPKSPQIDPRGPSSGDYRVLRGGNWYSSGRKGCQIHIREYRSPTDYQDYWGFRIALYPPPGN